jgi:hypothetical protein
MLLIGQVGELQVQAHRLLVAEAHLGIEQIAEEVGVRPTRGSRLLCRLVELFLGDFESKLLQCGTGFLLVGNAHPMAS